MVQGCLKSADLRFALYSSLVSSETNLGEDELRQALDGQKRACEAAQIEVEVMRERVAELKAELTAARDRAEAAEEQLREQPAAAEEAKRVQAQLQAEKERARQFWKMNCQ